MTNEKAITILKQNKPTSDTRRIGKELCEAVDMAIDALTYQDRMEEMWLDDMNNPLEPLKLKCALDSELFKLNYRKENNPKEINILDYTVIYALIHCLEEMAGNSDD